MSTHPAPAKSPSANASPAAALLAEHDQEAVATRRLLAAIPGDTLGWKPHERSFDLAQLAGHVAEIPGRLASMIDATGFDFGLRSEVAAPTSVPALLALFDQSLADARTTVGRWTAADLASTWTVTKDDAPSMALSKAAGGPARHARAMRAGAAENRAACLARDARKP